jgi:starch-binding outer membrane protein, SusD/RagB family
MKTIKSIIPIVLIMLFSMSCERDILDISPKDRLSEDAVWSDAKLIRAYHTELYNCVQHGFNVHSLCKLTDESFNSVACCGFDIFRLNAYNPQNIASAGGGNDFWTPVNNYFYFWERGYLYTRKINVFLEKMEEIDVESLTDKDQLIAEAKFLRAMTYFELIKRFGGVPIVTEVYELDDDLNFTRSSFDECVAFIEQDLSEAIPDLEDRYESTDPNYGRATVDACRALLSRMYLYAASPLFNPSNAQEKWEKAADAAESLLNRGYELYPDYRELFTLSQGDPQNEVIFSRGFTTATGHKYPMNNLGRRYEAYGGWWGSAGPSGNLMDSYEMINGEAPLLEDGSVNPASGFDLQNPYANRDPRFQATILHDDRWFHGDHFEMWISEDGTQWGYDSWRQSGDNPRTNTMILKFMPEDVPISWETEFTQQWPAFRLAEIYLNYAEAKFELGDEATAREYVNMVRRRPSVNMPDIPASVTGEDLRKKIINERKIELAFEDQRYFDVMRWQIGEVVQNAQIYSYAVYLDLTTGIKRYEKIILLDKTGTFENYKSLLPIAQDEILRTGMEQNPGY